MLKREAKFVADDILFVFVFVLFFFVQIIKISLDILCAWQTIHRNVKTKRKYVFTFHDDSHTSSKLIFFEEIKIIVYCSWDWRFKS